MPKKLAEVIPGNSNSAARLESLAGEAVQAPAQLVVQAPALPKALEKYLTDSAAGLQLTEFSSPEDAWQMVVMGQQMEAQAAILRGYAMHHLRSTLPPMQFAAGLAERKIARRTAYYWMDVFDVFERLGNLGVVAEVALLGVTKALVVKTWDDEQIKEFAYGSTVRGLTLDAAAEMSTRELDEQQREWKLAHDDQLRAARKECEELDMRCQKLAAENTRLLNQRQYATNEHDMPLFARAAREETGISTDQMKVSLEALRVAAEEHVLADIEHPEVHRYQPQAGATMYFSLAGVVGAAIQLMNRLDARFPAEISGGVRVEHQFTVNELRLLEVKREAIYAAAKQAAREREDVRQNTTPGKRGAPRGPRSAK